MNYRWLFGMALVSALALGAAERLHFPIKEYKLDNGLRVILSEDHSAPTYSICITYNVGSRNERRGAPASRTFSNT